MIHCAKCKVTNPPDRRRCQQCNADLLPGEGVGVRLATLLVSLLISALAIYFAYRLATGEATPNLDCALTSPIYWGLLAVVAPIWGLAFALKHTPEYKRYLERSKRHITLDPQQALADINQSLVLAPEKERAGILKQRAQLHQKLGMQKQATLDKLAYTQEPGAYQGGQAFAALTGIDSNSLTGGLRSGEQEALLKTGDAVAVGYCPKCKDAVLLDEKLRCKVHNRIKGQQVRFCLPEDINHNLPAVRETALQAARRLLTRRVLVLAAMAGGCMILYYLANKPGSPEEPAPAAIPTVAAEIPAAATASETLVFDQHGFRFEYPGDWETIGEKEISSLLKTSLQGMDRDQAEFIGGVYRVGLDNAPGCAQIVVVVLHQTGMDGTLSDEQFEAAKDANQEAMGSRLLEYNRVSFGEMPATESKHVGRSRESQLWEFIILPPQPDLVYLFSMSSSLEDYPALEPDFQAVVSSLEIDGASISP